LIGKNSGGYAARSTRISISLRSVPKSIGLVSNASAPLSKAWRLVSEHQSCALGMTTRVTFLAYAIGVLRELTSCLIATLKTTDGFEVSFGIPLEVCRSFGWNLQHKADQVHDAGGERAVVASRAKLN
jgi:hypothetical protein